MKLCKKKMAILVTVLCLMVVMVFVLCSFTPPSFDNTSSYPVSRISLADLDIILSIISLQEVCGSFNSLTPAFILYNSNSLLLYCALPEYSWSLNSYTSSQMMAEGEFVVIRFTSNGFTMYSRFLGGSVNKSSLVAYRNSGSVPLTATDFFSFSTSTNIQDIFLDVQDYWIEFYERLIYDAADEVESAYNHGYTDGYLTGNLDGYRNGYDEGIDYGYNVGYPAGYDSGLVDGYQTGFADGLDTGYRNGYYQGDIDGYESGYEEGYSEGYEEAERETVTVIQYVEPVEISIGSVISGISSVPDNILNGTFDFDLFGINVYGLLKVIIILFVISAVVVFVIKRSA